MHSYDLQILKLIEILKDLGMIKYDTDFCDSVSMSKQHLYNIKSQENMKQSYHFTAAQIQLICKIYNVDANWVYGFSPKPFRQKQTKSKQNALKN